MRYSTALTLLLFLAGCFRAETPIVTETDADVPFDTITYYNPKLGKSDSTTLVKRGRAYVAADEPDDVSLRFKHIADNVYAAQSEELAGSKTVYYVAIVRFYPDLGYFELFDAVADDMDFENAAAGRYGLRPCADEGDIVCIEDLEAFARHAIKDRSARRFVIDELR